MRLAGGRTAEQLYQRTKQRCWELEQQHGLQLFQMWECEWRARLERDEHVRALDCQAREELPGPLDLRKHALFGGRVEAFQLITDVPAGFECVALDFV